MAIEMKFDDQAAVDELLAAGAPAQQAQAHAEVIGNALHEQGKAISAQCCTRQDLAQAVAPLATKAELSAAVAPLATKTKLEALEMRLSTEIKVSNLSLKTELMKWWVTASLGQAAVIAVIVKLID